MRKFALFQLTCYFNDTTTPEIYTLSLHDALPISRRSASSPAPSAPGVCSPRASFYPRHRPRPPAPGCAPKSRYSSSPRSEEHTSELQSQSNLVCRLLLEKKNIE